MAKPWESDPSQPRERVGKLLTSPESVEIGPFGIFFSNKNEEMGLRGHSHSAEVTMVFRTERSSTTGFPAFASTYEVVQDVLKRGTAKPFRNATNEEVTRRLFRWCTQLETHPEQHPELKQWGGRYRLYSLELAVLGVLDDIGHADGVTRYRVCAGERGG
jgi:hypothetical protein